MDTSRRTIRSILALACFLGCFLASAQNVRYFKDADGSKETNDEGARYVETTTVLIDSTRRVEFRDTRNDRVLWLKHFKGYWPVGKWQVMDATGNVVEERDFDIVKYNDCDLELAKLPTGGEGALEEMPKFPGGEVMIFKYLERNIRYPQEAVDAGLQGTVFIQALVDENGHWQSVAVCRGVHPFLDLEAWRVSESMPDWTPAKQNGKPVACYFRLPVKFALR